MKVKNIAAMCIAVGLAIGSLAPMAEAHRTEAFQIGTARDNTESASTNSGIQSLTLSTAVERALQYHPDVRDARLNLETSERELEGRQATFTPRLSVETTPIHVRMQRGDLTHRPSLRISASQSMSSGLSTTANVNMSLDDSSFTIPTWTVGVSYPLFKTADLNSDNMSVRQSQINMEVARREMFQAEAEAIVDTIQLYHAAATSFAAYTQQVEEFDEATEHAKNVFENVQLGILSELDQIEAETELRRQQLALVQAERTYEQRLQSLFTAVGISDDDAPYQLVEWPNVSHPSVLIVPSEWIEKAKTFDPSLWLREAHLQTAEMQLQAEIENSKIEASVGANVGKGEDDHIYNWNVQVRFSYPLLDGGARQRVLVESEQNVVAAERAYANELVAFENRMQSLFDTLHDADAEAKIAELVAVKADMELEMAKAAYERGLSSQQDVKRATRDRDRAYREHQSAIVDVYIALWRLHIAAGIMPDLTALRLLSTTHF